MVGGRFCHRLGDCLVGGATHDVRVRALEKVELRRVVGLTVFGQVEAELPKLGALVGEKAVERVVEHRRYQLPHDQNSWVAGSLASTSDAAAARNSSVPVPQSRRRIVSSISSP